MINFPQQEWSYPLAHMTFGWELVVLHITPFMLDRYLVHAWRSCGHLKEKHSTLVCRTHFGMARGTKMPSRMK